MVVSVSDGDQGSASNETIVYWINFHEFHHRSCETEEDTHSPHHLGLLNVQLQDSSSKLITTKEGVERLLRQDLLERRFLNNLLWLRDCQMSIKVIPLSLSGKALTTMRKRRAQTRSAVTCSHRRDICVT